MTSGGPTHAAQPPLGGATRRGSFAGAAMLVGGLLLYAALGFGWRGAPPSDGHLRAVPRFAAPDDHDSAKGGPAPHKVEQPDPAVGFDALTALSGAQVEVRGGGPTTPCTWEAVPHAPGGRWRCGKPAWAFVGPYVGRAAGRAERCLWMHPHPKRATTVLRWADVPLGERVSARVVLLAGSGAGKRVSLRVRIDERLVLRTSTEDEWRQGEATEALAPGAPRGSLQLELEAGDNRWRMACVNVWMNGERPGPRGRRRPQARGRGASPKVGERRGRAALGGRHGR